MTAPKLPIEGVVYPEADQIARYIADGWLGDDLLGERLRTAARENADRIAVSWETGSRTYREMDERSERFGAGLLKLGLRAGDRVIFQIGNRPEFFDALYGCFKAGLIPVCTLPTHREAEIGFLSGFTEAKAHIFDGDMTRYDLHAMAKSLRAESRVTHLVDSSSTHEDVPSIQRIIDSVRYDEAIAALADPPFGPFDVLVFQLSGGTTGIPKVIPRFNAEYVLNVLEMGKRSDHTRNTVAYMTLPFAHNAAMACYNTSVHLLGGRAVCRLRHDPDTILSTIQNEKVEAMHLALPLLVRIGDSGLAGKYDLTSLVQVACANAAPIVEEVLGCKGNHLFGMAEGMCIRTATADPKEVRHRTIGTPLCAADEVRLYQPGTETEVAPGEPGEFCARGPYTLRGYFRAEAHNAKAFTADGFYRSGDLMRTEVIGGELRYIFVGRIKDNINRGGEKINAAEVEDVIVTHPAVRQVALVGMPDREYGERVCAFVIPEADPDIVPDVAALGAFLGEAGLAKFKWPERIEVVDNFPVTKVGKPSKGLLKDMITEKLNAEAKSLAKTA